MVFNQLNLSGGEGGQKNENEFVDVTLFVLAGLRTEYKGDAALSPDCLLFFSSVPYLTNTFRPYFIDMFFIGVSFGLCSISVLAI